MSASDFQLSPNKRASKMPKKLISKAEDLFMIPSTSHNELSMSLFVIHEVEKMDLNYQVDNCGNIIVTKGSGPYPCFCAHLDTVHNYKKGFNVVRAVKDDRTYLYTVDDENKRVGIGGDDKCGIFACLFLLHELENVKAIFFTEEECGGYGSSNIDLAVFDDCRFLGGIDRWNGKDFINKYGGDYTISKEFAKALKPILHRFGYSCSTGMFTDAFNVMGRRVGISCFNISCGYYAHHSDMEYVDLNELYHCCQICLEIGKLPNRYLHEIPKTTYAYGSTYNWRNDKWKDNKWGSTSTAKWNDAEDHYIVRMGRTNGLDPDAGKLAKWEDPAKYARKCHNCQIELTTYEFRYCTTCKPYFEDSPRSFDYYD